MKKREMDFGGEKAGSLVLGCAKEMPNTLHRCLLGRCSGEAHTRIKQKQIFLVGNRENTESSVEN